MYFYIFSRRQRENGDARERTRGNETEREKNKHKPLDYDLLPSIASLEPIGGYS